MPGRRTSLRINYKSLHETGERVLKEGTLIPVLEKSGMEGAKLSACIRVINDHISENQLI